MYAVCFLLVLIMASSVHPEPVLFFGCHIDEGKLIRSSVEHAIETYQNDLVSIMTSLEAIKVQLNDVDEAIPFLRDIHSDWKGKMEKIPYMYEANVDFVRAIVDTHTLRPVLAISNGTTSSGFENLSIPSSYNSISQFLTHFGRDWTAMGSEVRSQLYRHGIIDMLNSHIASRHGSRVLVPGAGMGRLAVELALNGYMSVYWCTVSLLNSLDNMCGFSFVFV